MKKLFTLLLFLHVSSIGQITTMKVAPINESKQVDIFFYDSTKNFLGRNVYKYIGQELYVNGDKMCRYFGYLSFFSDTNIDGTFSNVYKGSGSISSVYDSLVGKYFKVLNIIPVNSDKALYYLKLQEKNSQDIVYYLYGGNVVDESSFPFIIVGYFTKLKLLYIGKEYIMRGSEQNIKWKCVDVTVNTTYKISLVLQNDKDEKKIFEVGHFNDANPGIFDTIEAEVYSKKFGIDNWQIILDNNVKIGMSKEMCELSWGEPEKTNQTIMSGEKSEQWVYPNNNYLYFDNGILTAIQNH